MQICENQKFINAEAERIGEIIGELNDFVGRFSFNSVSRRKAAAARDMALLRHSLDNAKVDAEAMTEMQVRGLAAAVRLLNEWRGVRY